jgi:hypothetical protein
MASNNYWQRQERARASAFQARDEFGRAIEPPDLDCAYQDPRYRETRTCPNGHQTHRKASVGAFVCQMCGAILGSNGEWIVMKVAQ